MCRLAYVPRPNVVGKERLEELFTHLELAMGGHGNGLANTKTGKVIKGLDMEAEKLASIASKIKSPVLFHTRMASCGQPSDELCHPFATSGKWRGVVAHNGHWTDGVVLSKVAAIAGRTVSDSQAFTELIGQFGLDAVLRVGWPSSGIWMTCQTGGEHLVIAKSGDLEFDPDSRIWSSEFPDGFAKHAYEVEHGTYSLDMENPPRRVVAKDWFGFSFQKKGVIHVKQVQVRPNRRVQLSAMQPVL